MSKRRVESKPTLDLEGDPDDARRYWIETQDAAGGRLVPMSAARLVVGSSPRADLVIEDPTVSGEHCGLTASARGVVIDDLGSRNGTYVGGARVREAVCRGGAVIAIGRSTIVLHESTADEAEAFAEVEPLDGIAGRSLGMRKVAFEVRRAARHREPVLICGETGTGKELIAAAVHSESPRHQRPFVALNVAALPRELVESELFGHERGAFTGAHARRAGAFAEANGGTLFLDEIGELPLDAQPKLLRALDGYEVRSIGGAGGRHYDTRLVAATHVDIRQRALEGTFRRDLFHRLEVFVVEIPPLRERRGDIAAIARRIVSRLELGHVELTASAIARLVAHDWPGNVRELRNVIVRAASEVGRDGAITARDVERGLRTNLLGPRLGLSPGVAKALYREHGNNLSAAARAAGMARNTFRKLIV